MKGPYEVGCNMKDVAGFQLSSVIPRLIEVGRSIHDLEPVHLTDEDLGDTRSNLTNNLFEVITPMSIKDDKLPEALTRQAVGYIIEDSRLSAGHHVDIQCHIQLAGIDSEGNDGKNDSPGTLLPCQTSRFGSDICTLDVIRGIAARG